MIKKTLVLEDFSAMLLLARSCPIAEDYRMMTISLLEMLTSAAEDKILIDWERLSKASLNTKGWFAAEYPCAMRRYLDLEMRTSQILAEVAATEVDPHARPSADHSNGKGMRMSHTRS